MVEGTTVLRMSRVVDLAYQADVPLAINMNMAKMVTFETSLRIPWVVLVKQTVYWYSVYSSCGQDFLVQLGVLDGQLNSCSERGRGGGGGCLWIGSHSQFGRVFFYIRYKLRHVKLMKEGKEIFLDGLLNGTEGVAMSADARGRRGKGEEDSQPLDLDVDLGSTPEWRVVIEVGFKNSVDVRRV